MCGRFTQTKSRKEVLDTLGEIELPPLFHGRYNVAPTQKVAIIRSNAPTRAEECTWGLKNPRSGTPIINARLETLAERPMFKHLLSANRCLIPADGFYEWKARQPYYFQLPEKQLFAFAGLWQDDRCVIITRAANKSMQGIHDRMPAILIPDRWTQWIESLQFPDSPPPLMAHPVSRYVNKVRHDDPTCIKVSDEQIDLSLFPDEE
jgi:putative SOS response-associated peptidase YedK